MTLKKFRKKKESKGLTLYTNARESFGAAFRCDKGKLYAFLAVKKVTLHDEMARLSWQAKNWYISITIGDGEPRDEKWVSILDGRLLLARKRSTSRELFEAARRGTSVRIVPRYGDELTINIPADKTQLFRAFEERCGFIPARPTGPALEA